MGSLVSSTGFCSVARFVSRSIPAHSSPWLRQEQDSDKFKQRLVETLSNCLEVRQLKIQQVHIKDTLQTVFQPFKPQNQRKEPQKYVHTRTCQQQHLHFTNIAFA